MENLKILSKNCHPPPNLVFNGYIFQHQTQFSRKNYRKSPENTNLSAENTNLMSDSNSTQNLPYFEENVRRKSSSHSRKMRKIAKTPKNSKK